jgi:adenine-specific DNA-methyltransferase
MLRDDGVIFISIDENEVATMQQVCNEVFGESNYAATFIWTRTSTPPALAYKCRKTVEYVLAYERRWTPQKYFGSLLDNGDAPLLNTGNPLSTLSFPQGSVRFNFVKNGTVPAGEKDKVLLLDDILVIDGLNASPFRLSGHFKWTQSTLDKEVATGTYLLVKTEKFSIRFQRIGNDDAYKTPTNFMNIELNSQSGVGTNESAIKELENLSLSYCFDYPKPYTLIEALCSMVCKFDKEAMILDFFSGSATTAHAVMKLNADDGGKRKFIMVQLPEVCAEGTEAAKAGYANICEIGKERICRAGDKIKGEAGILAQNLDIGFRVLKLDDSNMKDVYYAAADYNQNLLEMMTSNIKEDRNDMDLLYGCLLDWDLLLSLPHTHEEIEGGGGRSSIPTTTATSSLVSPIRSAMRPSRKSPSVSRFVPCSEIRALRTAPRKSMLRKSSS